MPPPGPPRSGWVQQVAGANRRWRCQFRYRGSRRESAVAQLFSLGIIARMINNKDNPVAWALLVTELDEAREHLESLTNEMVKAGTIEDTEFAVQLGHIYAHLNRVWHSRSKPDEIEEKQWTIYSQFPKDLNPVG